MTTHTVYLKLDQITELTHKDILLRDVAQVLCRDPKIENRCRAMKIMTVKEERHRRYVMSALDVIAGLEKLDPAIQVENVGETDFVVAYKPSSPPMYAWQWSKTFFVCLVCFFGAAFAIMTFNNDVNVTDVFQEVYQLVMGHSPSGPTVLEAGYCIGLAVGIVLFFNHFSSIKLNTDPTPLEVEMRLYEDNIVKTVVANEERKEKKIDVT